MAKKQNEATDLDELDELDTYLKDSVRIVPEAIQEEFVRLPADLALWNHRYAQAYQLFVTRKVDADRLEALLEIEHRERLTMAGKTTESQVKAAVETDSRMYDARRALIDAEVEKVRLNGVLDAVRSKRDMLISIGAHQRAEMQGDPSIRTARRGASGFDRDRG